VDTQTTPRIGTEGTGGSGPKRWVPLVEGKGNPRWSGRSKKPRPNQRLKQNVQKQEKKKQSKGGRADRQEKKKKPGIGKGGWKGEGQNGWEYPKGGGTKGGGRKKDTGKNP